MANGIDRTWVGGLASGLDTQSLISKLMQIERLPVNRLEQKRNTLDYQKSMLQEVNMRLFDLQSRATDLTFSRTFKSKTVTASNDRVVNAIASTDAALGAYTLRIKQLATNSVASSAFRLAAPLEQGHVLASDTAIGGDNTSLASLGITAGSIDIMFSGTESGVQTIDVSGATTVKELITKANSQIQGNFELRGKLAVGFDEVSNQVRFTLLDTTKTMSFVDGTGGDVVSKMFTSDGMFTLNRNSPAMASSQALAPIRSGLAATLDDLGITVGSFQLTRGAGESQSISLDGLDGNSTIADLLRKLNEEIGSKAAFSRSGIDGGTGNPADRLLEFRFDQATGKINLVNTDSFDTTGFSLLNDSSNLVSALFGGAPSRVSEMSDTKTLAQANLATSVTKGAFTIDGQRISVDPSMDTLQDVLSRINSQTNLNAVYDSRTDSLQITRKDGRNESISMGSGADTSNFLTALGLIGGSQATAAVKSGSGTLNVTAAQARGEDGATLQSLFGLAQPAGSIRVTVGNVEHDVNYTGNESLNEFMAKIEALDGIAAAYYDTSTGKVMISTEDKGAAATLKLEDLSGGTLLTALNVSDVAVSGAAIGATLSSRGGISGVRTGQSLETAGFAEKITGGTFTINGEKFTIASPATTTLDGLLQAINANTAAGVRAEYDHTQGKLMFTSLKPGNTGISFGAAGDTSNFLSVTGLTDADLVVGENAVFSVDGMFGGADIVRQDNTISDVIEGVTLTLKEVTGVGGETINISADTEYARSKIDEFITAYNSAMDLIYTRMTEKRDRTVEALTDAQLNALSAGDRESYETLFKIGLLAGDSTLSSVRSRMRITMSSVVSKADQLVNSLASIGISTGVIGSEYQATQVGSLQIVDSEKLTEALQQNPDLVADLFSRESSVEGECGLARRLKDTLNEFTKTGGLLTQRVGRSGISASSEVGKQISLLNTQIAQQEMRLQAKEEALLQQFANLEKAMSNYQSQSSAFAQQLAQLTGG